MKKYFLGFISLTLLAACSGGRKASSVGVSIDNPREGSGARAPLAFALPGVPLRSEVEEGSPAAPEGSKETDAQAALPAPAEPAPAAPAAVFSQKDLDFHIAAADKYSARRKYRSAAAEYGAAQLYLPAGDVRSVHLLERQGAMMLRAGDMPRASGYFQAAIGKAKVLNMPGGNDLANAHLGFGYCLEKGNNIPEALVNYRKALEFTSSRKIKARVANTIKELEAKP